jgi:hypothetical protein
VGAQGRSREGSAAMLARGIPPLDPVRPERYDMMGDREHPSGPLRRLRAKPIARQVMIAFTGLRQGL